jgi:glycosyltransferase involved in cell wall biosynthesis
MTAGRYANEASAYRHARGEVQSQRSGPGPVALVCHEADLHGATHAVLRVIPLLEERGWRFTVWAPAPSAAQDELLARGYAVSGRPRHLRYSWKSLRAPPGALARTVSVPGYIRSFRRWLRSQSPAIVHANTLTAIPEALVSRRLGYATLLHVHELLPGGAKGVAAARLATVAADTVVVVSAASAMALRRRKVRARVVHNGVSLPERVARGRAQDQPLVVGTVGTVCRHKGSDLFVEAARRIREQGREIEFRMVGAYASGPEESWARDLVASAKHSTIRHTVHADVFSELAEWDIFVSASRAEAFSLVVLEAMATGVPVVATRVGGVPELVDPATGVLVEPDDAEALAEGILKLVDAPRLRAAMAAAGRRRAERDFTLEHQAAGLHGAYLAAVEASSRR